MRDSVILSVENLSVGIKSKGIHSQIVDNLSFEVNRGECIGIAGISGNGQSELFQILSGEIISENNSIMLNNSPIGNLNPQQRRKYLMAFSKLFFSLYALPKLIGMNKFFIYFNRF